MAETATENGDIVVKDGNHHIIEETENTTENNELSKSEIDSATTENNLKNTNDIIGSNLAGNEEQNNEGKELVSGRLNKDGD